MRIVKSCVQSVHSIENIWLQWMARAGILCSSTAAKVCSQHTISHMLCVSASASTA